MSRSSYSDDYGDDYPGQLELYRANVARSIRGKKGQARLRELHAALLAMPVKELHADTFVSPAGQACALGVWALAQHGGDIKAAQLVREDADDEDIEAALPSWPRLVVKDLIYRNDDVADGRHTTVDVEGPRPHEWSSNGPYAYVEMTPHLRYVEVLRWVEGHLSTGVASDGSPR